MQRPDTGGSGRGTRATSGQAPTGDGSGRPGAGENATAAKAGVGSKLAAGAKAAASKSGASSKLSAGAKAAGGAGRKLVNERPGGSKPKGPAAGGVRGAADKAAGEVGKRAGQAAGAAVGGTVGAQIGAKLGESRVGKLAVKFGAATTVMQFAAVLVVVVMVASIGGGVASSVLGFLGIGGESSFVRYSQPAEMRERIPDRYLETLQAAGTEANIPWTVLAAISQSATEHGRFGPDDVDTYGERIDRDPGRADEDPQRGEVAAGDEQAGGTEISPALIAAFDGEPSNWSCAGADCVVTPAIVGSSGLGPFLFDADWLAANHPGLDPQNVEDSAEVLARELARIYDELEDDDEFVAGMESYVDGLGNSDHYADDVAAADYMWAEVFRRAPVNIPDTGPLNAAGACTGGVAAPTDGKLIWPAPSNPIRRDFGMDYHPIYHRMKMHNGVDMGSPTGTPVWAAGAGTVLDAVSTNSNRTSGNGNFVKIDHGGGLVTVYLHLSEVHVRRGDSVVVGQQIGAVGSTGGSTSPHLHWETHVGGVPQNPYLHVSPQAGAEPPPVGTTAPVASSGPIVDDPATSASPQDGASYNPCAPHVVEGFHDGEGDGATAQVSVGAAEMVVPVAGVNAVDIPDWWHKPRGDGSRVHEGVDIFGDRGTAVLAAVAGTVSDVSDGAISGKYVFVDAADGTRYYYAHFDTIDVVEGDQVSMGQRLGGVGNTGAAWAAPHLHFEIRLGGTNKVDPRPILIDKAVTVDGPATGGGSSAQPATGPVAWAIYYGGLVAGDQRAGTWPDSTVGGSSSPTMNHNCGSDVQAPMRSDDPRSMMVGVHRIFYCMAAEAGLDQMTPDSVPGHYDGPSMFANKAEQIAAEAVVIGYCESGFSAANVTSSNRWGYSGIFQMGESEFNRFGDAGASKFELEPNVVAAARYFLYGFERGNSPWDGWGPWAVVNTDYGGPNVGVKYPALSRFATTRSGYTGYTSATMPNWAINPAGYAPPTSGCVAIRGEVWPETAAT